MFSTLALAALLIEAAFGYPDGAFRRVGHPVTWIGRLIAWCDAAWNRPAMSFSARRLAGAALLVMLALLALGAGAVAMRIAAAALPAAAALVAVAVLASTLLAQRSLDRHVDAVARGLETEGPGRVGLAEGRRAVSMIVGRDVDRLDEAGVSRAAIESLAESFSDGIVAPLFWLVVAGLPGALAYKAINTADSMIGHKSERYLAFGWAAARTDDLVNLPASRLAVLWLWLAAAVMPGASAAGAWATVRRDAARHASPNAGYPEAAMAGALGLKLAGPRDYDGEAVDAAWMGDGRAEATAADIRKSLALYRVACAIQTSVVALLASAMALAV